MIHSVFELGDTLAREVMVPRTDMVSIDDDRVCRQAMTLFLRSGFSRMPVLGEDVDDVVGPALPQGRRRAGSTPTPRPAAVPVTRADAADAVRAREQAGRRPAARDAARPDPLRGRRRRVRRHRRAWSPSRTSSRRSSARSPTSTTARPPRSRTSATAGCASPATLHVDDLAELFDVDARGGRGRHRRRADRQDHRPGADPRLDLRGGRVAPDRRADVGSPAPHRDRGRRAGRAGARARRRWRSGPDERAREHGGYRRGLRVPHRAAERRQVDADQRAGRAARSPSRRASRRRPGTPSAASSPSRAQPADPRRHPRAAQAAHAARAAAQRPGPRDPARGRRHRLLPAGRPADRARRPVHRARARRAASAARARRWSRWRPSPTRSTGSGWPSTSSPSTSSVTGRRSCRARPPAATRSRRSRRCSPSYLPPSPGPLYPDGVLTDEPELVMIAELVREAALEGVRDELPHSLAVVVEEIVPREGRAEGKPLLDVRVNVFVERDSPEGDRHRPRRVTPARGRHQRPRRHRGAARPAGAPRPARQGGQGLAARPQAARPPRLLGRCVTGRPAASDSRSSRHPERCRLVARTRNRLAPGPPHTAGWCRGGAASSGASHRTTVATDASNRGGGASVSMSSRRVSGALLDAPDGCRRPRRG